MSRERSLIKNTFILGIGTVLPKLAKFVTLPIYTAMLSKSEYGTYDLVVIITSLLIPILTLQIERAAFRFLIAEKDNTKVETIITNTFIFFLPISFVASLIVFIALLISGISSIISLLISIYVLLDINIVVSRQIARGLGQNRGYSNSAIFNAIANVVFVIFLLAVLDTGLLGLMISLNVALFVSFIYLIKSVSLLNNFKINRVDIIYIKEMLRYSLPMVPNSMSLWVMQVSDRLVVTGVLGIETNAVYAVSNKIPSLFALAYNTFNMAWQESASITVDDKDSEVYYSIIFNNLYSFLVGIMAVLIALTPLLFKILIRGSYDDAFYQMPILFLGIFFSSLSAYYGGIYIALKETKKVGLSSIIGAIINLVVNLLLINSIGLYAASVSTLTSYLVLTIYRMIDTKKMRSIKYNWKIILGSLLCLAVMLFFCYQRNDVLNIINFVLGFSFAIVLNRKMISGMIKIVKFKMKINKEC